MSQEYTQCTSQSVLFLGGFGLRIIPPCCSTLSLSAWEGQGGSPVGLKPWLLPPSLTSIRPHILKQRRPPQCLCAADAQAKQEGTGDRHWGLWRQTHIHRPSQCGLSLPLLVEMNITNITIGQTPWNDHIQPRAPWVAHVCVTTLLWMNLYSHLQYRNWPRVLTCFPELLC